MNRGKRSITVDLKKKDGVEVGAYPYVRLRRRLQQLPPGTFAALLVQEREVVARDPLPPALGDTRAELARDEE